MSSVFFVAVLGRVSEAPRTGRKPARLKAAAATAPPESRRDAGATNLLGAPAESDRAGHRVVKRRAGALRLEVGGFQVEVPAGLTVGVVDEHHAIFVLQAERLFLDDFGVLANEARAEHVDDEGDDGKPRKNVPGGDKIEAAEIAADGRDGGAARKPVAAGADLFEALIRENEVDGGGGRLAGDEFQDFVGRAVGGGRVRAHAKAVGDGLELL